MPRKKKKAPRSRGQTLGATYRAASTGTILASPAIGAAYGGARNVDGFLNEYRRDAKGMAAGLVVHAADQYLGQKVLGHNAALGRGSVTAWLSEAVAVAPAVKEGIDRTPAFGTAKFSRSKTGWSQVAGFGAHDSTKLYFGAKAIGGIVRKASNMSFLKNLTKPVKKMLGSMGGAL